MMHSMTTRQMTSSNGVRIGSNAETNLFQGGGPKKAGLPGTTNRPYTFHIALRVHPTRNTLFTQTNNNYPFSYDWSTGTHQRVNPNTLGLRWSVRPHKALKPISSTLTPNPYWTIPGTN